MAERILLIIRHAEKPEPGAIGVTEEGQEDPRSLTPRGWQRAGSWAAMFAPAFGVPALPQPTAIFASAPHTHEQIKHEDDGSRSQRPLQTVTPLARKLAAKAELILRFSKGQEADLAAEVSKREGVTLVCWQHEDIPAISSSLKPAPAGVPARWPSDRFNVMYRFDWQGTAWEFQQLVPVMLSGDNKEPIR